MVAVSDTTTILRGFFMAAVVWTESDLATVKAAYLAAVTGGVGRVTTNGKTIEYKQDQAPALKALMNEIQAYLNAAAGGFSNKIQFDGPS